MNLVANAVDAMPSGGTVTITTRDCYVDKPYTGFEIIPEGEYVILEISDMGIGIPQSDLEKIFEPFYTKKVMGRSGTGLGMSVVWGTVKDHEGFIDIITKEGTGTTFALYLPASRSEKETVTPIYIDDYLGKGESILVIDDSLEQRELAKRMMQRLGYDVHTAASGEAAVTLIKKRIYDLLILDMIMPPGMNGLETYRKILNIVPDQKAVIASGYAETERVHEAQRLGAGSYIKKPYTLEKIGLAVRSELDREKPKNS
jgi:CheY-like chemotaxis protein